MISDLLLSPLLYLVFFGPFTVLCTLLQSHPPNKHTILFSIVKSEVNLVSFVNPFNKDLIQET